MKTCMTVFRNCCLSRISGNTSHINEKPWCCWTLIFLMPMYYSSESFTEYCYAARNLDLPDVYRLTHFGCTGHAEKDQLYSTTFIIVFFTEKRMCTWEVKCSSRAKTGYLIKPFIFVKLRQVLIYAEICNYKNEEKLAPCNLKSRSTTSNLSEAVSPSAPITWKSANQSSIATWWTAQ